MSRKLFGYLILFPLTIVFVVLGMWQKSKGNIGIGIVFLIIALALTMAFVLTKEKKNNK